MVEKKYAVIQASRIKQDPNGNGLFDVKVKKEWYQVIVIGSGSKVKCEKRAKRLEKSLRTVSDDDDDDDDDDKKNDGDDEDLEIDADVSSVAKNADKVVNRLTNSASTISIADENVATSTEPLTQPLKQSLQSNNADNKPEFQQIMKALSSLNEVVGTISEKLDKNDQNTDQAPIFKLLCFQN